MTMLSPARYIAAVALLTCLALGTGIAPARASSASRALAALDTERSANGIPAGLTLDPKLSSDCAAHDHYMALHGLTHTETPGARGYSQQGAYAAANSVLAAGAGWTAGDPYESAPLHLDQLLAPRLVRLGSADLDGFTCTTTFPGWTRPDPPAPVAYTDPGPGRAVAPSELASEVPFTPQQLAGLPASARTGPVLIVLADAPGQAAEDNPATLSGATLTGPGGPVAVRTVDGTTMIPGGGALAPYIAPGGFIIPVAPLTPGASYHAHVLVAFAGTRIPADWSFTTTGADPHSSLMLAGAALAFHSESPANVRIGFLRMGGGSAPAVRIAPGRSVALHLSPGTWQACGRQPAQGAFTGYAGCVSLTVTGVPQLRLGHPAVVNGTLVFPLRASAVLRGRRATLTSVLTRGSAVLRRRTMTVVLGDRRLRLALPPRGDGLRLTLSAPAFSARFTPWSACSATAEWIRR